MSPSELGDVLAGFFAPAAFIVLSVALLLQGLELKSPREEPRETRDIVASQASQIKVQTESLQKQTEILPRQDERERFESILNQLEGAMRVRLSQAAFLIGTKSNGSRGQYTVMDLYTPWPEERDEFIYAFCNKLTTAEGRTGMRNTQITPGFEQVVEQILALAQAAIAQSEEMTSYQRLVIARLHDSHPTCLQDQLREAQNHCLSLRSVHLRQLGCFQRHAELAGSLYDGGVLSCFHYMPPR